MQTISRLTDKLGSVGALAAAMGCAACFPALASLAASLGLGFLSAYEGLFINKLLPLFALIVLFSRLAAWLSHRSTIRMIWGLLGPIMILATLTLFWTDNWSTTLFYTGLVFMIAVSIWDIVSPLIKTCTLAATKTSNEPEI